jgi:hypothetical protein
MRMPVASTAAGRHEAVPPAFAPPTGEVRPAGGGGGETPPPGCYPNGTQCRVGIQHMVYCCPDGQTWMRREGWCVGWWDALPCRSR